MAETDWANHPDVRDQPPFAQLLGLRITSAAPDRVDAELLARPELMNRNGGLHGGAIMALADHLGGLAAFLNIAEGESTVTLESKTNFIRSIEIGTTVTAVATPLHRGRSTMVWNTTISDAKGRIAAQVTQTQLTLRREDRAAGAKA